MLVENMAHAHNQQKAIDLFWLMTSYNEMYSSADDINDLKTCIKKQQIGS